MTDYIKLTLSLNPTQPFTDILTHELSELGFESFVELPDGLEAYIPASVFSVTDADVLINEWKDKCSLKYEKEIIKGCNWNAEWESAYPSVIIDHRLAILAPFHSAMKDMEFTVIIEPCMAFGTGHHPTTRLMARHLLDWKGDGKDVADMGCGSGILAILAEKKGAVRVLAADTDDSSVQNSLKNVAHNQCVKVHVEKGSHELLINHRFSLILANINRNVLMQHIPVYTTCQTAGDELWLSGFYPSDVPVLQNTLMESGYSITEQDAEMEWCWLRCVKK